LLVGVDSNCEFNRVSFSDYLNIGLRALKCYFGCNLRSVVFRYILAVICVPCFEITFWQYLVFRAFLFVFRALKSHYCTQPPPSQVRTRRVQRLSKRMASLRAKPLPVYTKLRARRESSNGTGNLFGMICAGSRNKHTTSVQVDVRLWEQDGYLGIKRPSDDGLVGVQAQWGCGDDEWSLTLGHTGQDRREHLEVALEVKTMGYTSGEDEDSDSEEEGDTKKGSSNFAAGASGSANSAAGGGRQAKKQRTTDTRAAAANRM